jgi:S-DNA-T family DNA segregation ATPase FtsK/SpoIIIE
MPAKKRTTGKPGRPPSKPASPPKRREIGALICLFLALFSFLGFFTNEGWFIDFFGVFMRGLIGGGFYVLVPALLLSAVILGFHRGKPVRMRLISTLLIPLLFGALLHLLICQTPYEWRWQMLGKLYEDGLLTGAKQSGGIFGGLSALMLRLLFGRIGAVIVFICGIVFLLLISLNITLSSIADWMKNRPRREYIPAPEPEHKPKQKPQKVHGRVFDAEREEAPQKADSVKEVRSAIDIPVDDPPNLPPEKPSFFDAVPKVKTPDQVFKEVVLNDHLSVLNSAQNAPSVKPPVKPRQDAAAKDFAVQDTAAMNITAPQDAKEQAAAKPNKLDPKETAIAKEEVAKDIEKNLESDAQNYVYPPADLLSLLTPGNILEGRENGDERQKAFSDDQKLRNQRRDMQCNQRPVRNKVRGGAGAGHQAQQTDEPRRRYRLVAWRNRGQDRPDPGQNLDCRDRGSKQAC